MPKKKSSPKLPKYIITYLCNKCGYDFALTERDKPKCFYCDTVGDCKIIKKQKLTSKAIADRLKLCTDRMMESLKGAYKARPKDDKTEEELLEAMARANKFRKNVQSLKLSRPRSDRRKLNK